MCVRVWGGGGGGESENFIELKISKDRDKCNIFGLEDPGNLRSWESPSNFAGPFYWSI